MQSVPAPLGRLKVGLVCGKPQGEVTGCMLRAPLLGPGYTPAFGLARHQQASVEAGDLVSANHSAISTEDGTYAVYLRKIICFRSKVVGGFIVVSLTLYMLCLHF